MELRLHKNAMPVNHVFERTARVDERISYPSTTDGCFAKGTRIITREGFKPIEEIKVGDWVLSSSEDGFGKPEYKRVLNTFVFKNKTIRKMSALKPESRTERYVLGVTGNHPFWVEGIGWRRADKLKEGDIVRLANGGTTKITAQFPVFRTEELGVGWVQNVKHPLADPANGWVFDYENYQILPNEEAEYDYLEALDSDPPPFLEVTVYNLEVEDFHTYYVTGAGIWVHNANDCMGLEPFKF
jgi:hypothetical protein